MIFDAAQMSSGAFYSVMIQTIIPRPIAWVLSLNEGGGHNLAPFSFFNGVASEPPLLMLAVGRKDDDSRKDTWENIEKRNDFVVHIAPSDIARTVVATSATLPAGESEVRAAGLETVPVEGERLPRLKGPRAALFCTKHSITEVGDERLGLILGRIHRIWVDDAAAQMANGRVKISPAALNPLARLGGKGYSTLGQIFDLERPG